MLLAYALILVKGYDLAIVYAIGLVPYNHPVLSKYPSESQRIHLLQGTYLRDPHIAYQRIGLLAYTRTLAYRQRCQKALLSTLLYPAFTTGFGLTGCNLTNRLVDRKTKGYWEPRFLYYAPAQLLRQLPRPEEAVHAGHVYVVLVDTCLLNDRHSLLD